MDPIKEYLHLETRRQFFGKCAMGLGGAALASLLPNGVVQALEQQAGTRLAGCRNSRTSRQRRNALSIYLCPGHRRRWICMTINR